MVILAVTMLQLNTEGINTSNNLLDYDKDMIDAVAANCQCPSRGAALLTLGMKSIHQITIACDLL